MPFEDLLTPPRPKCKTCDFLDNLAPATAAEVRAALAKAKYSDEILATGMGRIETEFNQAPRRSSVRTHREKGHA